MYHRSKGFNPTFPPYFSSPCTGFGLALAPRLHPPALSAQAVGGLITEAGGPNGNWLQGSTALFNTGTTLAAHLLDLEWVGEITQGIRAAWAIQLIHWLGFWGYA